MPYLWSRDMTRPYGAAWSRSRHTGMVGAVTLQLLTQIKSEASLIRARTVAELGNLT